MTVIKLNAALEVTSPPQSPITYAKRTKAQSSENTHSSRTPPPQVAETHFALLTTPFISSLTQHKTDAR